jgi:hypothetical protein
MWWFCCFEIRTLVDIEEKFSHKLHISWGILPEVWKDADRLIKKVDFCIRCHASATA